MDDCQISALDGMVNLGSDGADGFGFALAVDEGLGGVFIGFFTVLEGVAFCGAEGRLLMVVPGVPPTGDDGDAADPAVALDDGPLLVAFGIRDAVRSSSIFQRAGPTRQPVPRVIISPFPGRLKVRRYCRHGISGV